MTKKRLGPTKMAELLGVSRQTFWRAEQRGRVTRGADGLFDPQQTKRDWIGKARLAMRGVHVQDDQPEEPAHQDQHQVLETLMTAWATSLRSMALVLRERDTFDGKNKHFSCLGVMFLLQWKIVSQHLGVDEDVPLEFVGDMGLLTQAGGPAKLEQWLKKQPRINFTRAKS